MTEVGSGSKRMFPALDRLAFPLAAGLPFAMLTIDQSPQTDLGATSSGHFVPWYAVLATAIADLVGAASLRVPRSRTAVKLGIVGSALLARALLRVIAPFAQVSFASASDLAQDLFRVLFSGGNLRYLCDELWANCLGTLLTGTVGRMPPRGARTAPPNGQPSPGTSA
jgi:hypothetical protein